MNISRMFLFIGFVLLFAFSMNSVIGASDYSKTAVINDTYDVNSSVVGTPDANDTWSEYVDEEYNLYFATEMLHQENTVFSCVDPCVGEWIYISVGYRCSQWEPRSTLYDASSGKNCQNRDTLKINQSNWNESEEQYLEMSIGEEIPVTLENKTYLEGEPNSNRSEADLEVYLNTSYSYSDHEDWSDLPRDRLLREIPLFFSVLMLIGVLMVVRD